MDQELKRAKGLLESAAVPWAVAAGAAVYLYTCNRPPTDLDILVPPDRLQDVASAVGAVPERHPTPWGESARVDLGRTEVVGALDITIEGGNYHYSMDQEMAARVRTLMVDGREIPVLSPEDLIALKLVLQRGPEQGKHDLEDVAALAEKLAIDPAYLGLRLRKMGAQKRVAPLLRRWGWLSGN